MIAEIAAPHGTSGLVKVRDFTLAGLDRYLSRAVTTNVSGTQDFRLVLKNRTGGVWIAQVIGINTRQESDALRGTQLAIDRQDFETLKSEEYYHADLIGLEVMDDAGERCGKVHAIYNFGAGDIIEVQRQDRKTLLIPFTKEIVRKIDFATHQVTIDGAHLRDDDEEK
ncbi:MAG: ribosome maturation factor RimM [Pseudomonadota bacterium]